MNFFYLLNTGKAIQPEIALSNLTSIAIRRRSTSPISSTVFLQCVKESDGVRGSTSLFSWLNDSLTQSAIQREILICFSKCLGCLAEFLDLEEVKSRSYSLRRMTTDESPSLVKLEVHPPWSHLMVDDALSLQKVSFHQEFWQYSAWAPFVSGQGEYHETYVLTDYIFYTVGN